MHQKYYELHIILYVIRIQRSLATVLLSFSHSIQRPVYVTVYWIHTARAIFIVNSSAHFMWISIIYNKCENISCISHMEMNRPFFLSCIQFPILGSYAHRYVSTCACKHVRCKDFLISGFHLFFSCVCVCIIAMLPSTYMCLCILFRSFVIKNVH